MTKVPINQPGRTPKWKRCSKVYCYCKAQQSTVDSAFQQLVVHSIGKNWVVYLDYMARSSMLCYGEIDDAPHEDDLDAPPTVS